MPNPFDQPPDLSIDWQAGEPVADVDPRTETCRCSYEATLLDGEVIRVDADAFETFERSLYFRRYDGELVAVIPTHAIAYVLAVRVPALPDTTQENP